MLYRYDFDLKTGQSDTGLKACTYAIDIRTGDDGDIVYVQAPEGGTKWRLVELRPVSEGRRHGEAVRLHRAL